jgi:CRISPR type III-A-associated RAMP protein Csm4
VRWKGARFVPLNVVESLLAGRPLTEDGWAIDGPSECLLPASAQAGVFRVAVRSGAAVDRTGEGVAPYSTACVEFTPGSGLWFVAAFAGEAASGRWRERLHAALRLLADSGFGGERSRGWGRAEMPEIVEGALPDLLLKPGDHATETAHWMLSLFHPAENDAVDWSGATIRSPRAANEVESQPARVK